jgi:hypothetical protein
MSDARVVIGDSSARWKPESTLYGESLCDNATLFKCAPSIPIGAAAALLGLAVARAYVVTSHGGASLDAHRHDL